MTLEPWRDGRPVQVPRNKLGLVAASVLSCISVALLGLVSSMILRTADVGLANAGVSENPIVSGAAMASLISMMNFVLFFLTIPAAFLGLAMTLGRKPYVQGVMRLTYFREAAIVGALLVGTVCGLFGMVESNPVTTLGALLTGATIGALSGLACAKIYLIIVKPEKLGQGVDPTIFS